MRKLLLFVLLLMASPLMGQHVALVNFSHGVNGATLSSGSDGGVSGRIAQSWFGNYGTSAQGCSGQVPCVTISNSTGGLTYSNSSVCGAIPPSTGSNIVLDWGTTLAGGTANQIVGMQFPNPTGMSTVSQYVVWFCSNIPTTASFGTSGDMIQIVSPNNQISNYNCDGTSCWFKLEHGIITGKPMPYTVGTWVQLAFQYVAGGLCTDTTNFTDCNRMQEFDASGNQIGTQDYGSTGGGGTPTQITLGNGNNGTFPAGFHVQFGAVKMCILGTCPLSMFPMKFTPALPTEGIIAGNRAIDWSKSGISPAANAGTLPSASWTQCGSTVTAGSYSSGAINTLLNACSANTFLLLGPGNFTIDTSAATVTVPSNRVLRGSGANSTFIIAAGSGTPQCGQTGSVVCIHGAGGSGGNNTQSPGTVANWTAGYTQGTFNITLDSVAGIDTTTPTMLFLDQCDTGLSTTACTGTVTDNGQVFVCQTGYTGSSGCASSGADAGGSRPSRSLLEIHTACAINGLVVTLCEPLGAPIWSSGKSPQVWKVQPAVNAGIENLSIDVAAAGAATAPIERFNAYHTWISGVRLLNNKRESVNDFQVGYSLGQSSYLFGSTGTLPSNYGWRVSASAYDVLQNLTISHIKGGAIFYDGACFGCVEAYNYVPDSADAGSGDMTPITEHSAEDAFNVHEGSIGPGVSCDNVHGTCYGSTRYRNFWPGWESFPSTPLGTFTNSVADFAFARYIADIAGVYGTPGFHTGYTSASGGHDIYNEGTGHGSPSIPVDPLTKSTTLKWANYDIFHVGVMWCGNSLDTNFSNAAFCNNVSESPVAALAFPNFVPVIGDTLIGQPSLPASFYLTSKPSWFQSLPWPGIGPDISGGNVIQCGGTINTVGKFNGVPSITTNFSTCITGGTGWAGHVNANPAMACYLNVMGGAPDGSSGVLPFDAGACFGGTAAPVATFTPSSTNMGLAPSGLTSNPSPTVTLQNTGTANLVVSTISLGSAKFSMINNTCGSPATITNGIPGTGFTLTPGQSCTFNITYSPNTAGSSDTTTIFFSPGAGNPDAYSLSGTATGSPAPGITMAGNVILSGEVMF